MINLAISLAAAIATWLLFSGLLLDSFWAGILPFLIVLVAAYFYLARRINKKLEALMLEVQKQMSSAQTAQAAKQRDFAIDRAITTLEKGYAWKHWQFLIAAQLNSQIGQLYYIQKKFKESRPYLEKSYVRAWTPFAMLGCIHYRKKAYPEMKAVFEKAVKYNRKESLLWNLYAWCTWKTGDVDEAVKILGRGKEILPSDDRIAGNLDALRNKKKMKMRGWKEQWYQFHLENPPQPKMRMDRRSVFRGQ